MVSNAVFIIVELLFLAVAHRFGGPPWAVIGAIAFILLALRGIRIVARRVVNKLVQVALVLEQVDDLVGHTRPGNQQNQIR